MNVRKKSRTSVSVCCGVSVSVELSLVEVMAEAIEVGVSSSSLVVGLSRIASFASCDEDSGGGPSAICSCMHANRNQLDCHLRLIQHYFVLCTQRLNGKRLQGG